MKSLFNYLCSCINHQVILDYLSSSHLNKQLIQEEKCMESYAETTSLITQKQYVFKERQTSLTQEQQQTCNQLYAKMDNPQQSIKIKSQILLKQLHQQATDNISYSKVYDSNNQSKIRIYYKTQSILNRKTNIFKFSFIRKVNQQPIAKLLSSIKTFDDIFKHKQLINTIQSDNPILIYHRTYHKRLVIAEHDFLIAQTSFKQSSTQYFLATSLHQQLKNNAGYQRGWINLAGMSITLNTDDNNQQPLSSQNGQIVFQGYINIELNTKVSLSMLKQPFIKQIREYIQRFLQRINNS